MMFQNLNRTTAKAAAGILLSLYAVNASANDIVGKMQEYRCAQDPGPKDSAEKIQQRLNWAWKCYPDAMEYFNFKKDASKNMWDFPQGKVMAYPVFGVPTENESIIMQAPVDENAPCDTLSKAAPNQKIRIIGFCGLGCLTGDQVVLFGNGFKEIGSPEAKKETRVITLQEGANLRDLQFKSTPLRQIVTDLEAKKQTILRITTESGDSIQVTENHPLVDGEGLVRRADTLKSGEALVRASGEPEKITSIEKTSIVGKVYNLRMESPKIEENIYVAQGYLNGSMAIQNDYVYYLNRKLLRVGDFLDIDGL